MNNFELNNRLSFTGILSNLKIFNNLLKDLEYQPDNPRSAVAIIVKNTPKKQNKPNELTFQHDSILFLQRKKSFKDKFSGQICFPGGKQQKDQTLLNTVIRQTFQQTNIQLSQKYLLGCIDRQINLILSTKKPNNDKNLTISKKTQNEGMKKQIVVYAFVFMIPEHEILSQTIRLNKDEMESFKWVETCELMNKENICWFDYSQRIKGVLKHQNFHQIHNESSLKEIFSPFSYVNRVLSPAIQIGMNQKLYGITLYITLIMFVSFLKRLQQELQESKAQEDNKYLKSLINSLTEIKQRCQTHVVFQINKPIDQKFITFEKKLLSEIYSLRPKL